MDRKFSGVPSVQKVVTWSSPCASLLSIAVVVGREELGGRSLLPGSEWCEFGLAEPALISLIARALRDKQVHRYRSAESQILILIIGAV